MSYELFCNGYLYILYIAKNVLTQIHTLVMLGVKGQKVSQLF